MQQLRAKLLNAEEFSPYGQVIEKPGSNNFPINNGKCIRHHALAHADVIGEGAETIISIFSGQPYALPHTVDLVERHPLGSQAFYPLGRNPWLIIVCDDDEGRPVNPSCFLASPDQGVNLNRNTWHSVLTPLIEAGDFLVVDRGGPGDNLEEYHFEEEQKFVVNADL